jgi:hypothetical protein
MTFAMLSALTLGQTVYKDRPVSNHELRNEKRGRIVDAATGAGIPDAKVIAMWNGSLQNAAGSSGGCALQRIVTTDANGDFVIPDVSKDLDISMRGDSASPTPFTTRRVDFKWTLIVFKPGYVRQGDMDSFKDPDITRVAFGWESLPPDVKGTWGTVWVKPIAMQKIDMEPQSLFLYFNRLSNAVTCSRRNIEQPELEVIRSEMSRLVRPLSCILPASTSVKAEVAKAYAGVVGGKEISSRIEKLGQTGWPWKDTTAGVLCKAGSGEVLK